MRIRIPFFEILPYYLGNEVIEKSKQESTQHFILYSVLYSKFTKDKNNLYVEIFNTEKHNISLTKIKDITLVLRPIENILEQELLELWELLGWNVDSTNKKDFLMIGLTDNHIDKDEILTYKDLNFISHWMRKKGFDMDELIPRGYAMKKEKKNYTLTDFL